MKKYLMKIILSFTFIFLIFIHQSNAEIYTSISGKVTAEDTGHGIENVSVHAVMIDKNKNYYATTDKNGIYVLKDLLPGIYKIGFSINNSPYISVKPYLKTVLTKGKNVVNANHILRLGGSVSGTVYDSDGITPLSEIMVSAKVPDTYPEWIRNFAGGFTDDKGKFLLQGLPESDTCIVKVEILAHAPLIKQVEITKGSITENINFIVKWDDITGVNGHVKSSLDNNPIEGSKIILRDVSGNEIAYAITDETGKYSIVGVPPGTYQLTALWLSYSPGPEERIDKENVLIKQGESTVVDFVFHKPSHL
jgi:uncharacterized surface anchored protein